MQTRGGKLWSQIEATFKQMDTAATELECFQALQRQEQLAASHRINGLWEEVKTQKELEQTLQRRYGNLLAEQERIEKVMGGLREQARIQEEIAAKEYALKLAEDAASQTEVPSTETPEPVAALDELGNSMLVDVPHDEAPPQTETLEAVSASELVNLTPVDLSQDEALPRTESPEAVASGELENTMQVDMPHDEDRPCTETPEPVASSDELQA